MNLSDNTLKLIAGLALLAAWFAADYFKLGDATLTATIASLIGFLAGAHTAAPKTDQKTDAKE